MRLVNSVLKFRNFISNPVDKFNLIYLYYTILLLYGFEESCILISRGAVRKNPYSDRGP